jgi:hypothetical protein
MIAINDINFPFSILQRKLAKCSSAVAQINILVTGISSVTFRALIHRPLLLAFLIAVHIFFVIPQK